MTEQNLISWSVISRMCFWHIMFTSTGWMEPENLISKHRLLFSLLYLYCIWFTYLYWLSSPYCVSNADYECQRSKVTSQGQGTAINKHNDRFSIYIKIKTRLLCARMITVWRMCAKHKEANNFHCITYPQLLSPLYLCLWAKQLNPESEHMENHQQPHCIWTESMTAACWQNSMWLLAVTDQQKSDLHANFQTGQMSVVQRFLCAVNSS